MINSSHLKNDGTGRLKWSLFGVHVSFRRGTPPKANMTMEKQPFEDGSPIKNGDFPAIVMLVFGGAAGCIYFRM